MKHSNEKYSLFTIVSVNVCLHSICRLIAFLQYLLPLLLVHWLHKQMFDDSQVGIVGVCRNHSVSFDGIFHANLLCRLGVRSQEDWLSRTHIGGAIQAILSPTHDPGGREWISEHTRRGHGLMSTAQGLVHLHP